MISRVSSAARTLHARHALTSLGYAWRWRFDVRTGHPPGLTISYAQSHSHISVSFSCAAARWACPAPRRLRQKGGRGSATAVGAAVAFALALSCSRLMRSLKCISYD